MEEQQYTEEELIQAQREEEAEAERYLNYPRQHEDSNLFTLFNKVMKEDDNAKLGNLNKEELGNLFISVRDCLKIADLADELSHPTFAAFFRKQAEIILRTSASKRGWFVELFISQKSYSAQKHTEQFEPAQSGGKRKWKWFQGAQPNQ